MARSAWIACALLAACGDLFKTTHGTVDEGIAALAEGNPAEAVAAFDSAASDLPENRELHYDRGLAASAAGQHKEGVEKLLRASDPEDATWTGRLGAALGAAYVRWALAVVAMESVPAHLRPGEAKQGEAAATGQEVALDLMKRALEHLEAAVRQTPDDPDLWRNLEIVLLWVDPPCKARDDELEPNQGPGDAKPIELASGEPEPAQSGGQEPAPPPGSGDDRKSWKGQLMSCPDDADWFKLGLEPGDRLSAKLVVPSDAGKLALALYTHDGQRRLQPDDPKGAELRFTAQAAGEYLLRVENLEVDEVSYGLEVEVRPHCARVEDSFEDNDQAEAAKTITPGPLQGLKTCPGDEDWFALTLAGGESLVAFAELTPAKQEGDGPQASEAEAKGPPPIQLEVRDETGVVRAEGAPVGTNARIATLLVPGAGRYLVRVRGAEDLEERYSLLAHVVPPCPEGDDKFDHAEDNDLPEDAADLDQVFGQAGGGGAPPGGGGPPGAGGAQAQAPEGPMLLRICPGDVDWFKLSGLPDKATVVKIIFEHAKGDLDLDLYDGAGKTKLETSEGSTAGINGEAVGLPKVDAPTLHTIQVRARQPQGENFYLLSVDHPEPQGGGDSQDDQKDEEQKQKQDPKDKAEQETPLEQSLDNTDRNRENLEAKDAKRRSSLANHPPVKDW
jgi:tetratricopeptide (TPR) repeat protein